MQKLLFLLLLTILTGCGIAEGIQRNYILSQSPFEEMPTDMEEWPLSFPDD